MIQLAILLYLLSRQNRRTPVRLVSLFGVSRFGLSEDKQNRRIETIKHYANP